VWRCEVPATWTIAELGDDQRRLAVQGELDLEQERPLVEEINALLEEEPGAVLIVDLSEVEFIDSSGVRALLRVHQTHGDRVRLGEVSTVVRRVLEIAGVTEWLSATADTTSPGTTSDETAEAAATETAETAATETT
jgi:anti-sigma B factor antagonist